MDLKDNNKKEDDFNSLGTKNHDNAVFNIFLIIIGLSAYYFLGSKTHFTDFFNRISAKTVQVKTASAEPIEAQKPSNYTLDFDIYDLRVSNISDVIEKIELNNGISIEEYINSTDLDKKTKKAYINRIYSLLYQKYGFDPNYYKDDSKFKPIAPIDFDDYPFIISQNGDILKAENIKTGKTTKIDVSKFVVGVSTPERIMIYSTLQKMLGIALELLYNNVEFISSAKGTVYGGCFDGKGIYFGNTDELEGGLAHELGHAIDVHYNEDTKKIENYSSKLLEEERYRAEIKMLYETGLFGKYEPKTSESELYAECVRYLLKYSNNQNERKYFREKINNTLHYVESTMKEDIKQPTANRKIKFNTESLQKKSIPLFQCRKLTGTLMPTDGDIKSINVNVSKAYYEPDSCAIATSDINGNWSQIKQSNYKNGTKEVFEKYSDGREYYKKYIDGKLMIHNIIYGSGLVQNYKYEYDSDGNRTKDLLYDKNGQLVEIKEY